MHLLLQALLGAAALALLGGWLGVVLRQHRIYRRWRAHRPRRFERNLVVIGGGAAGLVSAYIANALKARVTLVQAGPMGGDCLNFGCVPSKALIRSATLAHQMRHAAQFGLRRHGAQPEAADWDFSAVMQRIQSVIASIAPQDSVERYTALGVEVLQGHATITSPWTVSIQLADGSTRTLSTRSMVIAAGAKALVPDLPGLHSTGFVTSDTLWEKFASYPQAPARMVVLGGGPVGCELAQSFARLGSQVTLVEAAASLLAREDRHVAQVITAQLQADGVRVLSAHTALRCEVHGEQKRLEVRAAGGEQQWLAFDELLVATGRQARLQGYGLEALGIPVDRTVQTNAYLQTLYPNIYAAGDVAGPHQLTHAAAHQAWHAAVNALLAPFKQFRVDYAYLPQVTYTAPEVARVGLNQSDALAQGIPHEVTRFDLQDLDRALADGEPQGFVEVLTVPGKDRILGVTIVGSHAGDMLTEYVLAMKHGLGLRHILGTVHSYPGWSDANKLAAGVWQRAHQPRRLLALAEKFNNWRRGRD